MGVERAAAYEDVDSLEVWITKHDMYLPYRTRKHAELDTMHSVDRPYGLFSILISLSYA